MFTPVLRVRDVEVSLAFYTRLLGFQGEGGLPGLDGKTVFAEAYLGDAKIMLTRRGSESSVFSASSCGVELYLTLPQTFDIQQLYSSLRTREVHIVEDLHQELWGDRAFTITDPDGYRLIIAQPSQYAASVPLAERHIA
jgi:uncharacterized glyoxalase superfamily protein PhnB